MKKRLAFTLIELIVVVAIMGILTAVVTVSYSGINARGRDAQRINDLTQLKLVLSTYYNAQTPTVYVTSVSVATLNGTSDPLTTTLVPGYIRAIPLDPSNTGSYLYKYQSLNSAKNFKMTATLENKNNKKGWGVGSSWIADGYIVQDD